MATAQYTTGERLLLPVLAARQRADLMKAQAASAGEPARRRHLRSFLVDPGEAARRLRATVFDIVYEPLKPGPRGRVFAVDGAIPEHYRKTVRHWPEKIAQWGDELDLENPALAASMGLVPSTGNPRFAAQMVYTVCQRVFESFTIALGREPTFGGWMRKAFNRGGRTQLLLQPLAFDGDNAYYDPQAGSLQFGYFTVGETTSLKLTPGSLQQYALSHDIIAHELTHALLDGLRAHFLVESNPDVAAFHEGFADLIAVLHHFTCPTLVRESIEETGGIHVRQLLSLGGLLGESDTLAGGSAMRLAVDALTEEGIQGGDLMSELWKPGPSASGKPPLVYHESMECHERGAVLVAAVLEAFLYTFRNRARAYRRLARVVNPSEAEGLPAELIELLTNEVRKLGEHFLQIVIRAIDYCPPIDITFGDFLRAMITADRDMVPDDQYDYRGALVRAFRRRGIRPEHVLDLSEESLCWNQPGPELPPIPGLAFSRLRLSDDGSTAASETEVKRWAAELMEFAFDSPERLKALGLMPPNGTYDPPVVESINVFTRRDAYRHIQRGLIAEITQVRNGRQARILGGVTVIFGETGRVRYLVRKRVSSERRREASVAFAGGGEPGWVDLRRLHARRSRCRCNGETAAGTAVEGWTAHAS